jgi:flagellar hook assembly protein FlgD
VSEQNYHSLTETIKVFPNPSRSNIYFIIPVFARYSGIKIFDIAGKNVRDITIVNHGKNAQLVKWDRKDNFGNLVPAGVYFVHFNGKNINDTKKVTVLR